MADGYATSETPSQEQVHTASSPQDKTEINIVVTRGVAKRKRRASSIDSTSHSNNNNTETDETAKKIKTCSSSEQQQQQQSASESGDPVAEAANSNNTATNTISTSEAPAPEASAVPTVSSSTTKDNDTNATNNSTVKENVRQGFASSSDAKRRVNNYSKRWRVHQMAEDYVDLVSNMMLFPTTHLGPYGYSDNHLQGNGDSGAPPSSTMARQQQQQQQQPKSYPLELISSFGFLKSPLRRPTIIEKWSPYEVSLFEAGIGHYGKDFHQIHRVIQTKSTKEVIDFYYIWKKTSHYKMWKKEYVAPGEILSDEEYTNTSTTPIKKPAR